MSTRYEDVNEIVEVRIMHKRWSLQGGRADVFVVSSWSFGAIKLKEKSAKGKDSETE